MTLQRLIPMLLAIVAASAATAAGARTCELDIACSDQPGYDTSELVVESDCTEVILTLTHTGTLAVAQAGHNWTLTRTADWKAVARGGQGAGPESEYLPTDDERIIANTEMLGGGEKDWVGIDPGNLETGGDYTYFCSFPGHWSLMNGKLVVR